MRNLILTFLLSTGLASVMFAQGTGCPSIQISSYQGTNLPSITLPCDSSCVTLNANVFQIAQTTSYSVSSIPYNGLPYSTSSGVQLAVDDYWSSIINLPFNFCFFGNVYNRLVVSTNGAISFNTQYAGAWHNWQFAANNTVPSNTTALRPNSIFGAMHDMDPGYGGTIRYGVQGTFPCRAFVMSFENIPHYDCHSKKTTQQIVLYEGTNAIEVYIQNKPGGCSWNGGRAVIGIQNAAADLGYSPPNRNTGTWSASNEAWRFMPTGAPAYQITWHENNVTNPAIATGPTLLACPSSQFTTYSALLTYTNCANETNQFWSAINVNLNGPPQPNFTSNSPVCEGQTLTFNAPAVSGATYFWTGPGGWTSSLQNPTRPSTTAAMTGTYNLYIVVNGCTSAVATQQVLVVGAASTPTISVSSPVCEGSPITLTTPTLTGATYYWTGPGGFASNQQNPTIPSANSANAGSYSLHVQVGGCVSGTISQNVVVNPTPAMPNFTVNSPICTLQDIQFDGPAIPGADYNWTGPGGWTANVENPVRPTASIGMSGDYYLTVTVNGCTSTQAVQTITVNGADVPAFNSNSPVCTGDSILFNASPVAGATYVWSGPGWTAGNIANPFISGATASMSGNYSLYVVSNGCTSATTVNTVFVNPLTAPPFTSNSPICEGQTLQLFGPADSTATYYWSGPGGWTDSVSTPTRASATAAMSGNYNLYMVSLTCTTATTTHAVTVNPIPAAPVISSNSPVCKGSPINLTGPTIANATYSWTGPNGYTSSTKDNTLTPSTLAMAGTYQLTVQVAGCTSPSSSLNVVVNDKPDITPNVSPLTPCQGSPVDFNATVTVQPPSVILGSAWDVDGNLIPDYTTIHATHTYNTPGSYNATLAVIATGNCTSTVVVPIVVNPKPTVSYTGPTDKCGVLVGLTSTGQVASPGIINDYTWYLNGGTSIGNGQNLNHSFTASPFEQVNGYVISTTTDGCSDTATYSINLQPSPFASFNVDSCIGLNVPFTNGTTWIGTPAPGTTLSYAWQFGDGQSGSGLSPTHNYTQPGVYTVTLTATSSAFACKDTAEIKIKVSTPPTVQIEALSQCFQNVAFTASINSHGSHINTLAWNLDDGSTASDTSFIHEYQNSGSYNVSLTATNAENCTTTTVLPVVVTPSVTLSGIEIPNVITPNGDGVNDELKLDSQFEECQDYEMFIFNRWGVVVYKQVKGGPPFSGRMQNGKTPLHNGVYFITIKSGQLEKNGTITIAN